MMYTLRQCKRSLNECRSRVDLRQPLALAQPPAPTHWQERERASMQAHVRWQDGGVVDSPAISSHFSRSSRDAFTRIVGMAFDEPSAQLQLELRASTQSALNTRRPLLHHLNADTSWLLQLPRPETALKKGGRLYYNILIDPWLAGGQSDVASWFSQQFHASESAVKSIAEVEELARESEILTKGLRLGEGRVATGEDADGLEETFIDAIAISHPFTDHCHKETLLEVHPDVPVFAVEDAADLIRGWKHFRAVVTTQSFGVDGNNDWRSASQPPLPEWISICRLLQRDDFLNYHSAVMIAFNNNDNASATSNGTIKGTKRRGHQKKDGQSDDAAEAVIYTPHGIYSGDLNLIPTASPPIRTLAFLHGLHNVRIGTVSGRTAQQLNSGAHNGLKAQRVLNAKYWIGTHDEVKKGLGLVSWFLQRDIISLPEALKRERKSRDDGVDGGPVGLDEGEVEAFEGVNWIELGNGESRVLI